jgi:hypothetical protein
MKWKKTLATDEFDGLIARLQEETVKALMDMSNQPQEKIQGYTSLPLAAQGIFIYRVLISRLGADTLP